MLKPRYPTDREMSEKRALQAIIDRKEILSSEGVHRLGFLRGLERGSAIANDYIKYAVFAEVDITIDLMFMTPFADEDDWEAIDVFLDKLEAREQFLKGYFKGIYEGAGKTHPSIKEC